MKKVLYVLFFSLFLSACASKKHIVHNYSAVSNNIEIFDQRSEREKKGPSPLDSSPLPILDFGDNRFHEDRIIALSDILNSQIMEAPAGTKVQVDSFYIAEYFPSSYSAAVAGGLSAISPSLASTVPTSDLGKDHFIVIIRGKVNDVPFISEYAEKYKPGNISRFEDKDLSKAVVNGMLQAAEIIESKLKNI